ncbi:NOL1/NOP2/sun family putative RNA methylase [Candidatus Woesearchaeota archaeon]|nr:NOL1/NOP2/sun family putative RNA methylase [Candidatus Woesearchaeota archaeon]
MMNTELTFKPAFEERYTSLTDWNVFKDVCATYLRRSIRVNTLKISVPDLVKRLSRDWNLTPIPWCSEGFWITHKQGRRDVGNLIEHSLGYIYIQEAASMIPPIVLGAQPGEIVLDMCAAPGSKTSQIAAAMQNTGVLVANDFKGDRIAALGINLQRCGALNTTVTQMQGHRFGKTPQCYDRVLCDAPCSGTGTIRKSLKTLRIWNPTMITRLSTAQKQLIYTAYSVLRDYGTLVYSTCSLEPEENEGVVDSLLSRHPKATIEKIDLPIKRSPAALSYEGKTYDPRICEALRIWPQDNDTEGFFVCKIRKNV